LYLHRFEEQAGFDHKGVAMHASLSFINGAGRRGKYARRQKSNDLGLLNTLLSSPAPPSRQSNKSKDERQAEEESKHDTASTPGSYQNDPDDPNNPNEVRERSLKEIDKKINR
jgi:hypothetical protein